MEDMTFNCKQLCVGAYDNVYTYAYALLYFINITNIIKSTIIDVNSGHASN